MLAMNIFLLFTNGDLIEMCMVGRSLKMEVPDSNANTHTVMMNCRKEGIIVRGWPAIFFNKSWRTKEGTHEKGIKKFRGVEAVAEKIIDL